MKRLGQLVSVAKTKQLWTVGYKWTVADCTRYGHTVVTADSQEAAEAWLQAKNPHATVLPIAQWETERNQALSTGGAA